MIGQEPAGEDAVGKETNTAFPGKCGEIARGAPVKKRILHLRRRDIGDLAEFGQMRCIEIRNADQVYFALAPQRIQLLNRLDMTGHAVVPPMELHEVQPFKSQSGQGPVNASLDLRRGERRQTVAVGNELRVYPDAVQPVLTAGPRKFGPESAENFLDAGVDVGAIEGADPGIGEKNHVGNRPCCIDPAMVARKLPTAPDHLRDRMAGPDRDLRDLHRARWRVVSLQIAPHFPCPQSFFGTP